MKTIHAHICCALLVTSLFAAIASAQINPRIFEPTRISVGATFLVSDPKEDFGRNVNSGFGGGGSLVYHLDRKGWLGIRFDGSGSAYGHEKKRVPLSPTIGARILADLNTTNWLAGLSFGPELAMPRGVVRPYVNAALSGVFFRTSSSLHVDGTTDENIASTTNHSDNTRAWVYGGGVRIPLWKASFQPSLDLGLQYFRGGRASYLREGSIQDNPDGSVTIFPLISSTPYVAYLIGVCFRIPYDSASPCPRFLC